MGARTGFEQFGTPRLRGIDLRGIPPMGFGVDVGLWSLFMVVGDSRRISPCALHEHFRLRPAVGWRIATGIDLEGILMAGCSMAKPAVGLKLNPCGGQQIDRGGVFRTIELPRISRQELATDDPRVGGEQSSV